MHLTICKLALLPFAAAMIGYDCSGEGINITTLSLLDIGIFDNGNTNPKKEDLYIQLMQTSDYDRIVSYYGMHSHVSMVHNRRREFILEVEEQSCNRIHDTGTATIANAILDGLTRNSTNYRSAIIAGSVPVDGKFSGTQYSDACRS
ncbi:hypothetical protein PUN28_012873 [Cardiocondyla obscurior]|uniref:Uncharacterized protein n=1 Tax=Cardiocondyla obscurior TaxID=286306 RepID=A0AAW2F9P3_9HYME